MNALRLFCVSAAGAALVVTGAAAQSAPSDSPYGSIPSPYEGVAPKPSKNEPPARGNKAVGMGPLAEFLPQTGGNDVWRYRNDGESFRVTNENDAGSIDYVYVGTLDGADRRIEARVRLAGGAPDGFAGLLLGFDERTRDYHIFALSPNGSVSIFRHDREGFRPLIQSTNDAVRSGENVLTVEERGDDLRFLVNGVQIAEIGSDGLGEGAVGVGAGGLVDATFASFDVQRLD